ncbi:MAG: ribonuclease HII [Acidimicrobiales bacterium]
MMRHAEPTLKEIPDNADDAPPTATDSDSLPLARQRPVLPRLTHEQRLWREGYGLVAGVDEVGRGAWAGPLTVGVAVMAPGRRKTPVGLRDSKMLAEDVRESIFDRVASWCAAWAVGHVGPDECDRFGMTAALRLATRRAFAALPAEARPDAVVLDGNFDYVSPLAEARLFDVLPDGAAATLPVEDQEVTCTPIVRTLVKADATCASVAAASVLAKVTRDRLMRDVAHCYPAFEFDRNKGYPSPTHKRALCGYGLSAIHRRSWVFAEQLPWRSW